MLFQGLFSSNELFISCHELRQIRSIFCDLLRDVKPIRDGHWQSAYADGNHACCFSYDCGVGMFFSFLLCCFFVFDIHISWAGKVSTTIVTDLTASFHVEAPSYFGVQSYENFCDWAKKACIFYIENLFSACFYLKKYAFRTKFSRLQLILLQNALLAQQSRLHHQNSWFS